LPHLTVGLWDQQNAASIGFTANRTAEFTLQLLVIHVRIELLRDQAARGACLATDYRRAALGTERKAHARVE
jgi:hypothetical protein